MLYFVRLLFGSIHSLHVLVSKRSMSCEKLMISRRAVSDAMNFLNLNFDLIYSYIKDLRDEED